jgi:hypothetical protein
MMMIAMAVVAEGKECTLTETSARLRYLLGMNVVCRTFLVAVMNYHI